MSVNFTEIIKDLPVIRLHSPDVSSGVDQPCEIERQCVPEYSCVPGIQGYFVPTVNWNPGRDQKTEDWHQNQVESRKKNIYLIYRSSIE